MNTTSINANTWNPKTLTTFDADSKQATESFIAYSGQSTFELITFAYAVNTGSLQVYKNGLILVPFRDWIEVDTVSFALNIAAVADDEIVAVGLIAVVADSSTIIKGQAVVDVPSIATGASFSFDIPVTGVIIGDHTSVASDRSLEDLSRSSSVNVADIVRVTLGNLTGAPVDLISATFTVIVQR